ncbi:ribosomal protein S7 [Edhazardia aedis USNM 41457]|uniref:Ribosomal protein S7 n=1 Tax=Edhazardia aedis (strain USNM 41457) TaxID=1003232 RepID=J9DHC3_EDHAE|nr:ribosomal protein S7 [Edhazardia aedis USNM 41457]|eukprot:EJW02000.1 ribosomal protein S7 [Edhazardia aedis USNM 41457]
MSVPIEETGFECAEPAVYDIKLFGKHSYDDVVCKDLSLAAYINLSNHRAMPHTANRNNRAQFGKAKTPITERLVCQIMRCGKNNGKKRLACKTVETTYDIIKLLTGQNPIQVLVDAIINSGPREDSARVGRGGSLKRTSVDVAPLRRINIALYHLVKGVRSSSAKNIKTLPELLADELINAAKNSPNSYAVKKKDEIERIAKSNR